MKDKKHLLLKLLCFTFMLGSTAAGAAACKDKPTEPSIPEGYDKTFTDAGSYYADEGEARYTFELTDSTFTLKLGGQTIGGTYLFNGTTLRLVTTDGTIIEATYSDAAIKFTYNGMSYTFIKNVEYTVTFEMNGGSAQADVKVLNGKKLDKATLGTPTKGEEGEYAFFGWYKDKDFKNEYSFDQLVTNNLKLYARFVKLLGKEEFSVTLEGYEGEDFAGKTEGRLLGNLPALAAKNGAEFDGWWYSAYNDAAKLTAKMEKGAEVKENLILYPVWKTAAPNVSVTEKEIISTAIDGTVTIFCGEKQVAEGRITNGKYAYDFSKQLAGDYVITVKSKTEETKAYYKNKALARVSLFDVVVTEQGRSELHFNAVEGAEKYLITVACGTQGHLHTDTEVKDAAGNACTVFDFTDCDMREGGMTFVVKAEANGYLESVSATYNVNRKLETPASVTADGTTAKLSWTAVKHANYYLLTIDTGEAIRVNSTEYDIKGYGKGEHTFSITAVGKGWNNSDVANYTWTKETLAAPAKPTIVNGYTVTWDAVEGAQGYVLKIGEKEITRNGTSYTLTDEDYTEGQTSYVVSVLAKGATAAENSLYSDTLTVTSGAMDGELKYENGTLSWNPGFGVTKYDVKVNDGAVTPVRGTSAKITLTKDGANVLYVRSYNAANVASAWVEKTVTAYTVSYNVGESEKKIADRYYAVGDGIDLPKADFTGYGFGGWFDGMNGAGTEYKLKDGVLPKLTEEGNLTLYAKWNPNEYQANFNVGEFSDDVLESATVKYKQPYVLPVPKSNDTNKAFTGWFDGTVQLTDQEGKSLAGRNWQYLDDRTLTAQWVEILEYKYQEKTDSYYVSKPAAGIKYLKELTIPETYKGKPVTRIESTVFAGCSNLVVINIPDRINEIETVAFTDCSALEAVNIIHSESVADPVFYSVDGVILKNDAVSGTMLYFVPKAIKGDANGTYRIPDGVATIPEGVFEKREQLKKIVVPASVVKVQAGAFYYARTVEEIEFVAAAEGEEEKELTLEDKAFNLCSALKKIVLPARVSKFKIFADKEDKTFGGGYQQSVFRSCSALEEIHVSGKPATGKTAAYSSSENGLLLSADGKTLIFYPRGIKDGVVALPDSVTEIGDKAFYGNTAITEFVVPLRIVSIGASAFENCSKLAALSFEGGEGDADLKIGERAFYACTSLQTLTLTENVRYLGRFAFGRTTKLEEVFVNSTGTVKFEDAAFASMTRNSNGEITGSGSGDVKTLHIGKGLANVDISSVFGGSSAALATVTVDPENGYYYEGADGVIYDKNINETTQQNVPTKILYYPVLKEGEYRVPDTISEIANNTFVGRKKLTKILIGNNITAIGDSAFDSCTGLQEVVWLPLAAGETENKLTIGDEAFRGCYNKAFTTFTLPGRVVSIGKYAFAGCDELTAFNFEEVVWSLEIGQLAFYGCDGLTELVLPEKTVSVGNGAFASCENLVKVVIPATAERLGEWVKTEGKDGEPDTYTFVSMDLFTNSFIYSFSLSTYSDSNIAPKLAQVVVKEGNKRYMSKGDMLYGKYADENDATTAGDVPVRLYYCPTAKAGEVTLPLTLKEIYKQAFICNKGVTKIQFEQGELSGSLTIGENALLQAEKLTTFVLPNGLEKIETGLFKNCTGLTTIEVPNTVKSIAAGAFENCISLSNLTFAEGNDTLPLVLEDGTSESGTYTGVFAYYSSEDYGGKTIKSCKALTSIKFPKRLSSIGAYAFYYCENFATAEFDADSDLSVIGDLAFANTALSKIKLGSEEPVADESGIITMQLPKKITDIRVDAFSTTKLSNRTRLVIPKTVERFGAKKVYTYTGLGMFYHSELKEIVFEANSKLTTVEKYAFANAFGVNSVYKPTSGLTRVDFGDNSALETLPDSAFSNAQMLESVNFGANSKLKSLGRQAFQKCYKLKQITFPATIQTLGNDAFSGCTDLASVTFETFAETNAETGAVQGKSLLTSIGSNAFEGTGLTSFEFPSTKVALAVGALGETMFKNCKSLTTVKLSDTVTDITKVFDLCGSITKLEVPMENGVPLGYFVEENGILYNVVKNAAGEATTGTEIAYALGDVSGTFTVKEGITVLKASVFAGKANLKKVVLPQSLIEIEDKAFMDCFNLEEVTFAENCVLSELGEAAFKNCIALKSIAIPNGVTKLNPYTFYNCRSLKTVTLPNQLTHIGYKTYSEKDNTEVISTSGGYVFAHCESLSAIDIPETVKFIQPYSFLNCKSLTKVEINVESGLLGEGAFAGCSALQEVVLCQGLQALPTKAFADCTSLSRVYTKGATGVAEGTADLSEILGFGYKNYSSKKFSFSMGTYTFLNCTSIREVKLSEQENFKALGNNTFDGCTNLAYVNKTNVSTDENAPEYISKFPDQMIYLGTYTFRNTALTSVRMPNSLRSLGSTAPSDTGKTGLPSGLVAGADDEYKCTPSTTTSGVFDGCTKLTKVDLNNVVRIGGLAFRNCPLTDVAGTKNAKTGEIEGALDLSNVVVFGKGAFAGTGLKAVDLTGVWVKNTRSTTEANPSMGFGDGSCDRTTLETSKDSEGVFENCKQLEKVTFSNKTGSDMLGTSKKTAKVELGELMFKNCTALKKIELPKSTTSLKKQLFYGCSALNEVVISGKLSTFGDYAFAHCSALQSIDLSTANVTSVSTGMFDGCTSLADVKLNPNKVATIYSYAFRDCASLVNEVPQDAPAGAKISAFNLSDLPLLKQIGDYAFEGCGFTKVELGKLAKNTDVLTIGAGAFAGCAKLTQVVLPENVMDNIKTTTTTINSTGKVTVRVSESYGLGAGVFAGCPNLSKISVVTDVGTLDYSEDNNSKYSNTHYDYRYFGYEEKNGVIYRNTGDVVEIDGEEVRLKLIVGILESKLPADGVLTLKENERLLVGALDGITAIKKVVLPEGMTVIDANMFKGMQGLEEVVISSKTTSIGTSAFEGSSVKKVTYSGAAADAEGGLLTTRFPETLTQIGKNAFRYTKLEKVILPATLKNGTYDESTHKVSGGYAVGSSAFFGSELQSVVIEGSETYIDGGSALGAFGNCEKLTDVQFLADTAFVGWGMFAGCTALQNVTLPKNPYFHVSGNTSVGKGIASSAFMGCTGLTSVVLSGDIIEIDYDAFKNCTNLTSVTLPEGVVTLGGFDGCEKLQSINIPSTVEKILSGTFDDCVALKQVVIPASVTSLKFSFDGWTADQTIYIEGSPLVAYNQWASDDRYELPLSGFCSFMKKDGSNEKEVIVRCNAKIVWNYKAPAETPGTEGK